MEQQRILPHRQVRQRSKDFSVKQHFLTRGFSASPRRQAQPSVAETPRPRSNNAPLDAPSILRTELVALVRPDSGKRVGKAPAGCAAAKLRRGVVRNAKSSSVLDPYSLQSARESKRGVLIRADEEYDPTRLFVACSKKDHKEVRRICRRFHGKDEIKARGLSGFTALHYACSAGASGVVRTLLTFDQSLLFSKDDSGNTALHVAARQTNCGIMETLIAACATRRQRLTLLNAVDNDGRTALSQACEKGRSHVVYALRNFGGCDDSIQDCLGDRAIDYVREASIARLFACTPSGSILPAHHLHHVFSFVDPASQQAVQLVSQEWRWLLQRYLHNHGNLFA